MLREKWLYDNGSPFPNCHHRGKDKACKKYESGACVKNSSALAHEEDGYAKIVGYVTLRSEDSGLPLPGSIIRVNSSIGVHYRLQEIMIDSFKKLHRAMSEGFSLDDVESE
jgi:hypothetical protein